MRKYLFLISFILLSLFSYAQDSIVKQDVRFTAKDENLWGKGSEGLLNINIPFFNEKWNESSSFGSIGSLAGFKFGLDMEAATWGNIGAGLEIQFGTEKMDINYPAEVNLKIPKSGSFNKGDEITIETSFTPNEPLAPPSDWNNYMNYDDSTKSYIKVGEYNPFARIWANFRFGFFIGGEFCFFDCTDLNIIPRFELNLEMDLVRLDKDGVTILDGSINGLNVLPGKNWGKDQLPIEVDIIDGITVFFDLPNNKKHIPHIEDGYKLVSQSEPKKYAGVDFNIFQFISGLKIPYVSAIVKFFEGEVELGPLTAGYVLIKTGFEVGLYHNQKITFTPKMNAKFDFPTDVSYRVNQKDGALVKQGNSSSVTMQVGDNLKFTYPCNYDFLDVDPYYTMGGSIRNRTYDSIAFDFYFQMIDLYIELEAVVVIPKICIPIYEPCGPWYCYICDWCYVKDICTPPIVFDGWKWHLGPLLDLRPNIANVSYNWVNNNWDIDKFNSVDRDPLRLRPAKYSVSVKDVKNASCYGLSDGKASVIISNGSAPYQIECSNGFNKIVNDKNISISNLSAGTHYVIVKDNKGCVSFTEFVVSQPEYPLGFNYSIIDVDCFENANGEIDVEVNGGSPDYSFQWSNGSTNEDLSNVVAGTYTLTITDINNCQLNETFEIKQPEKLNAEYSFTDILCFGNASGTASTVVTGGLEPYSYTWSNGKNTSSIDSLVANNYTLTISDANMCKIVKDFTISQPTEPLTIKAVGNAALCNGDASGVINVEANGGTNPYSYSWYQGEFVINKSEATLDNLYANTYRAMIVDANGCKDDTTVVISEPELLKWTFNITDNLCFGESKGIVSMNVSGGVPGYSYNWSNGETLATIENLTAGLYSITVTDNNNCIKEGSFEVKQPSAPLQVSIDASPVKCFGSNTGKAVANVSGGTYAYTYSWSNNSTSQTIENLTAGTYTLTVVDNNLCETYGGTVVSQPKDSLSVSIVTNEPSCYGFTNGSISINADGGTTPYYLRWDDNDYLLQNATHNLTKLSAGMYRLIVSDANNCINEKVITINQPDSLTLFAEPENVDCFGMDNGSIDLSVVGGKIPYSYRWSDEQTSQDPTSLVSGYYNVTVTDSFGCAKTEQYFVGTLPELNVDANVISISCSDNTDGKIVVSATGGDGNYSYLWSNASHSAAIENLPVGTYTLTLTDGKSCSRSFEYIIETSTVECIFIPSSFTPNGDGKNDTWVIKNIDLYEGHAVKIFNRWGNIVYEGSPYTVPWDGKYNGKPVPAETYYYVVDLNNGQEPLTGPITIIR